MKVTICAAFGTMNFRSTRGVLNFFKVTAPFSKQFGVAVGGATTQIPVSHCPRVHGYITRLLNCSVDTGEVYLVQGSRDVNGSRVLDGAVFVRPRVGADFICVTYKAPPSPDSIIENNELTAFMGPADIMSVEELERLGFVIPRGFRSTYLDEEEIDELFSVKVVVPGQVSKPVLAVATNESGEKVVMEVAAKPRRIVRLARPDK